MSTSDTPDGLPHMEGLPAVHLAGETTYGSTKGAANGATAQNQVGKSEKEFQTEYFCGCGKWFKPRWLQVFRDAKFFTFLLSCYVFIEGALVSGFTSVVLSTIERRYRFNSTVAGLIAAAFDMSVFFSVLFISYFGGKGHKPRWLGVSLILQGLGAFIFALPQFLFGPYDVGNQSQELFESCNTVAEISSECTSSNKFALFFFFFGNVFIGVGAAPLFTVGLSYLDDIVRPRHVSIHMGVFFTSSIIGPALGFGLGGAFLSIYVDPWRSTTLEPTDPGWVGAWWLCFIFSAVVSWFLSIPFFMFPRLLPNSHIVKMEREKEMAQKYTSNKGVDETDFVGSVKSFPYHLKQVVCTPSWVFITLAVSTALFVVSGMVAFAPKYLESQFGLTASTASLVAGSIAIPAGGLGALTGALIIYFGKIKPHNVAILNWVVSFLTLFPLFAFLIQCPTVELAGVTVPYADGSLIQSDIDVITSSCTAPCQCNSTVFEPVCGGQITYFSPCRAGCQKNSDDPNNLLFENCTCVAEREAVDRGLSYSNDSRLFLSNNTVTEGRCDQGCNKIGIYLAIIGVAIFLLIMLYVPDVIVTVRCVADEQRSLALGLQSLVFRAAGSIPGPIVFGVIFDSACIYWQYECSRRGNCWVYNNSDLSHRALSMAVAGSFVNFVFSFLAWIAYPRADRMWLCFKKKEKPLSNESSLNGTTELADRASINSSDSYTIEGPKQRPTKRSSNAGRMESHCSEDLLLESSDDSHLERNSKLTGIEAESGFFGDTHDLRARSVERTETSSPVIVESPPRNY